MERSQSVSSKPNCLSSRPFDLPSEEGIKNELKLSLLHEGERFMISMVGTVTIRDTYRPGDRPADVEARWKAFVEKQPPRQYPAVSERFPLRASTKEAAMSAFEAILTELGRRLPSWPHPFGEDFAAFRSFLSDSA